MKRIVRRNRAVAIDVQHLAHEAARQLRLRPVSREDAPAGEWAGIDEERPIRRLDHASFDPLRVQQHLDIGQALVVAESRPRADHFDLGIVHRKILFAVPMSPASFGGTR